MDHVDLVLLAVPPHLKEQKAEHDRRLARYRETVDPKSPLITLLSPQGSPDPYFAEFGWVAAGAAGGR